MTVISQQSMVQYPANGSATVFPVRFLFLDAVDLIVGTIDANGNFVQSSGNTYTVKGAGVSGGGSVTFLSPPASGLTVDIRRSTPNDQQVNFSNLGSYLPENVTAGMDAIELQIQDLIRRH